MLPILRPKTTLGFKRRWFTGQELLDTLNFVASEAEHTLDESKLCNYWDGTSFGEFIDEIYKKYGLYEDDLDRVRQPFGAYDTQHRYTKANIRHLLKNMKIVNQELFDSVSDDEDMLSTYLHIHYDIGNQHYYYDDASFF